MEALLTTVGGFVTESIGWMGQVMSTVASTPALTLMVIAIPVAGFAIGGLARLIRL